MLYNLLDLQNKEVINVKTGRKLGYVDNIEFESETAEVVSLSVYGRPRFFGLFGRDDDMIIKYSNVEIIGEDIILVKSENILDDMGKCSKKRGSILENLYK